MNNTISIRFDGVTETLDYFKLLANDKFPYAFSEACNTMGFKIRDAEMQTMREVFDRPKEQTIRNIKVFKGTTARPGVTIAFDQIYRGDEYMVAQVDGGPRKMKRSEKRLGHYYVPGAGAELDQYGNMKPSQIVKILSALGRFSETGYMANRTDRSTKRLAGASKLDNYFILAQKTNGLPAGVYQRVDKSHGQMVVARALATRQKGVKRAEVKAQLAKALKRGVIPVMIFVSRPPDYQQRFPFHDVAARTISQNWGTVMGDAVNLALRTSR